LLIVQFVAERGHIPTHVTSIHDGIEEPVIANVVLPFCVSQIPRVTKLAFSGL
jgi:hypothetical protein